MSEEDLWSSVSLLVGAVNGWTSAPAKSSRFFSTPEEGLVSKRLTAEPSANTVKRVLASDLRVESKAFVPRSGHGEKVTIIPTAELDRKTAGTSTVATSNGSVAEQLGDSWRLPAKSMANAGSSVPSAVPPPNGSIKNAATTPKAHEHVAEKRLGDQTVSVHASGYQVAQPKAKRGPVVRTPVPFAKPFYPASSGRGLPPPESDYTVASAALQLDAMVVTPGQKGQVPKTPVFCKFFAEGFCANDANCRYLHSFDEIDPGSNPRIPMATSQASSVQDTTGVPYGMKAGHPTLGTPQDEYAPHVAATSAPMPMNVVISTYAPMGNGTWDPSGDLCNFYISNECKYGPNCRYLHGSECPSCGQNVLHPTNTEHAHQHLRVCVNYAGYNAGGNASTVTTAPPAVDYAGFNAGGHASAVATAQPGVEDAAGEILCGLCFNQPRALGRKFGLLENCEHPFCLECIREYRDANPVAAPVRNCPICFVESDLVLPSFVYVVDPGQREELFTKYVQRLGAIPCKHFNYGAGNCPFATQCYYAHEDRSSARLLR